MFILCAIMLRLVLWYFGYLPPRLSKKGAGDIQHIESVGQSVCFYGRELIEYLVRLSLVRSRNTGKGGIDIPEQRYIVDEPAVSEGLGEEEAFLVVRVVLGQLLHASHNGAQTEILMLLRGKGNQRLLIGGEFF